MMRNDDVQILPLHTAADDGGDAMDAMVVVAVMNERDGSADRFGQQG